jgi:hypothetical protein
MFIIHRPKEVMPDVIAYEINTANKRFAKIKKEKNLRHVIT